MTKPYHSPTDKISGPATVPKVRLYVERPGDPEAWLVNIGHVVERGRWKTKPHAHPGYGQVIFVRNGCGVMNLDGSSLPFQAPCALLVPMECVHGLDYEIDADRWVVTIEVTYLMQINARLPEFAQLWTRTAHHSAGRRCHRAAGLPCPDPQDRARDQVQGRGSRRCHRGPADGAAADAGARHPP